MAATQVEIARRVGLDVSSVNKILNRRRGSAFKEATVKKVFRAATQLGYSLERLKRLLIGEPLATAESEHERLTKFKSIQRAYVTGSLSPLLDRITLRNRLWHMRVRFHRR